MNYLPIPRAHSSSADILGQDGYKGKPDWDEGSNVVQNPQ